MPKGDRLKLKADPEDGTTPIANLLLEAVAMAKLSGLQKGAIIYLWRQTYGWLVDGKRLKEAKITLKTWEYNLCATKSRISTALKELEESNIIKRRVADQWGGYYYTLNTDVSSWNHNVVNVARLSEVVGVAHFGTVAQNGTIAENDNSCPTEQQLPTLITVPQTTTPETVPKREGLPKTATVAQNGTEQLPKTEPLTLYKEILKKELKKEVDVKITSPTGEKVKEVFGRIDKLRGYRPPKRKAEATSIIRMLKGTNGVSYSPNQIIEAWQKLKEDKFWQDKELYLMTVESQIGALLSSHTESKPSVRYVNQ